MSSSQVAEAHKQQTARRRRRAIQSISRVGPTPPFHTHNRQESLFCDGGFTPFLSYPPPPQRWRQALEAGQGAQGRQEGGTAVAFAPFRPANRLPPPPETFLHPQPPREPGYAYIYHIFEVTEVIDLIFEFTVHPHQKRRLWRQQSLGITAPQVCW